MKIKIDIPADLSEVYREMLQSPDPVPPVPRSKDDYRRSEWDRGVDRLLEYPKRLARLETMLPTPAAELEAAPSLEEWAILNVTEAGNWFATGSVVGSTEGPGIAPGGLVVSGRIRSVDVKRRWARDDLRLYRLGRPTEPPIHPA